MQPYGTAAHDAGARGGRPGVDVEGAQEARLPREELVGHYAAYRRREARTLVGMLPKEAVRPLYRRAVQDSADTPDGDDPMTLLLAYCERLLPLPSFEVWLADLRRWPDAHWSALENSADAPSPAAPATVDVRGFVRDSRSWLARLRAFRDGDAWRGFIAFEEDGTRGPTHRTTLIFRESSLSELRDRFRGFESASLEAFLRSALP